MNIQERYESAKEIYAGLGVDVDAAVERLNHIPVSMHCWQGDDVMGFELSLIHILTLPTSDLV